MGAKRRKEGKKYSEKFLGNILRTSVRHNTQNMMRPDLRDRDITCETLNSLEGPTDGDPSFIFTAASSIGEAITSTTLFRSFEIYFFIFWYFCLLLKYFFRYKFYLYKVQNPHQTCGPLTLFFTFRCRMMSLCTSSFPIFKERSHIVSDHSNHCQYAHTDRYNDDCARDCHFPCFTVRKN